MLCVGPVFVPYMALPLAQEWHWKNDCNSYPVEIHLHGQPNASEAAIISIYITDPDSPTGLYPPRRVKLYDFKLYTPEGSNQTLQVVEYIEDPKSPASNTSYNAFEGSIPFPPVLKTLVLSTTQRRFVGCSARYEDLVRNAEEETLDQVGFDYYVAKCSEGGGTYEDHPGRYLRFAINNSTSDPTSTVYLQSESSEWAL
ncbi:hypothetical protein EST38_g7388 [Candolleomyces aberdarensis]|uniref:Uncharacterized protein n=1 Tax=Candolleomyces aberdarensis TaxID=2316362 RepID=A0A4Q2DFC8_9AGAR|nr:hypothetical protein EST38_g7388 [Candolleomyces aberdarensis]